MRQTGDRHPIATVLALALAVGSALVTATGRPARAQGSARAWGLCGAGTAAARGLDAVDWNPANLALPHPSLSLGLAAVAADLHNNSFTLARYNQISGATLNAADKARLLRDIPGDGFTVQADVRAAAAGVGLGNAALTFGAFAGGSGRVAKDFFDLVLLGNSVDRAFAFDGTGGEGYAVGAATLSLAAPLWTGYRARLCAGANLRYLRGLYELHFTEATGGLVTTLDGITGDARASYVSAQGGVGYAVDLGLALQAPRGWTLGLVCDNAASALDWDREAQRREWTVLADTLDATQSDLDALVSRHDTTFAVSPYRTTLPRRLRLGASNTWGSLLLAVDAARGLADRAGVTTRTEVRAGLEWLGCGWLRPRAGAAIGGQAQRSAAAGLGLRLGPWRLDLAVVNRGRWWPRDTKGLAVAAGSRLEF